MVASGRVFCGEPFWNENTWNGFWRVNFYSEIVRMVVYAIPGTLSFFI